MWSNVTLLFCCRLIVAAVRIAVVVVVVARIAVDVDAAVAAVAAVGVGDGVGLVATAVWIAVNIIGNSVSVGVTDEDVANVTADTFANAVVAGDDVGDNVYTLW